MSTRFVLVLGCAIVFLASCGNNEPGDAGAPPASTSGPLQATVQLSTMPPVPTEAATTTSTETCTRYVRYVIDSTDIGADIEMVNDLGISERSNPAVFGNRLSGPGMHFEFWPCGQEASLTIENRYDSGFVMCAIEVDGQIVVENEDRGPFGVARCSTYVR